MLSFGQERAQKVIMVELTVPREEGCVEAHEREMLKYQSLEVKGGKRDRFHCGQRSVHWEYQGEDGGASCWFCHKRKAVSWRSDGQ